MPSTFSPQNGSVLVFALLLNCATLPAEVPIRACEAVVYLDIEELMGERSNLHKLILVDQYPSLSPRRQILIREDQDGVSVEVRTAVGQAIDLQLQSLRKKFPEVPLTDLCTRLRVVRQLHRLEHPRQAGITELLAELEELQAPVVLSSDIVLDGPILDIWISHGSNFSHFSMMGNDLHPLHLWTNRLWEEINSALLHAPPSQ